MLTTGHIIEFASAADAAAISQIAHSQIEYGLHAVYTPARVHEAIRDASRNVIVARNDGDLAGFAIMRYGLDRANLDLLAVESVHRRRGVATSLLHWLLKVAACAGIANVFVQVRRGNGGAIAFYQARGFHVIDEIPRYYQGREYGVIMCLGLRPIFPSS